MSAGAADPVHCWLSLGREGVQAKCTARPSPSPKHRRHHRFSGRRVLQHWGGNDGSVEACLCRHVDLPAVVITGSYLSFPLAGGPVA